MKSDLSVIIAKLRKAGGLYKAAADYLETDDKETSEALLNKVIDQEHKRLIKLSERRAEKEARIQEAFKKIRDQS